jgi:hypothetical protein
MGFNSVFKGLMWVTSSNTDIKTRTIIVFCTKVIRFLDRKWGGKILLLTKDREKPYGPSSAQPIHQQKSNRTYLMLWNLNSSYPATKWLTDSNVVLYVACGSLLILYSTNFKGICGQRSYPVKRPGHCRAASFPSLCFRTGRFYFWLTS